MCWLPSLCAAQLSLVSVRRVLTLAVHGSRSPHDFQRTLGIPRTSQTLIRGLSGGRDPGVSALLRTCLPCLSLRTVLHNTMSAAPFVPHAGIARHYDAFVTKFENEGRACQGFYDTQTGKCDHEYNPETGEYEARSRIGLSSPGPSNRALSLSGTTLAPSISPSACEQPIGTLEWIENRCKWLCADLV